VSLSHRHRPVIPGQVKARPFRAAKPATPRPHPNPDSSGHSPGHHDDPHRGDAHHGDDHRVDAHDGEAPHADGHHGNGHGSPGHHGEGEGHHGDGHHGDGHHGEGHHPLFHVNGPGGHIAVFDDRIEIHRHGLLHILLEILLYYEGSTELVLPIRAITGISLVEPMVFPGYIRFYFDGSPNYSKDYWTDAMAPNTVLLPYFDHRQFHRLRDFIVAKQAQL
jgi:hypothetical protein